MTEKHLGKHSKWGSLFAECWERCWSHKWGGTKKQGPSRAAWGSQGCSTVSRVGRIVAQEINEK